MRSASAILSTRVEFSLTELGRRSGTGFRADVGVPGDAFRVTLGLGHEVIELLQFDRPGRPYPAGAFVRTCTSSISRSLSPICQLAYRQAYFRSADGRRSRPTDRNNCRHLRAAPGIQVPRSRRSPARVTRISRRSDASGLEARASRHVSRRRPFRDQRFRQRASIAFYEGLGCGSLRVR